MLTKQTTPKLLEKYEFPKDGVDRQIWQIANRKVTFNFLEKKITISGNTISKIFDIRISFQEIETLYRIMRKEEINV